MLVLTRKEGESLVIGENITLTVLGIKGGQVRIGIEAPKGVPIHRQEILSDKVSETDESECGSPKITV